MDASKNLRQCLRSLSADPLPGADVIAGLARLRHDIAAAVPSWTAVTIVLVRPGGELPVTVLSRDTQLPLRASLTVPLRGRHPDLLVLRAAAPGASLLLADDLALSAASGHCPHFRDRLPPFTHAHPAPRP